MYTLEASIYGRTEKVLREVKKSSSFHGGVTNPTVQRARVSPFPCAAQTGTERDPSGARPRPLFWSTVSSPQTENTVDQVKLTSQPVRPQYDATVLDRCTSTISKVNSTAWWWYSQHGLRRRGTSEFYLVTRRVCTTTFHTSLSLSCFYIFVSHFRTFFFFSKNSPPRGEFVRAISYQVSNTSE